VPRSSSKGSSTQRRQAQRGETGEVQLAENSAEIHLMVSDSGWIRHRISDAMPGSGLTSMQERVRLVGGTIVIDSKPLAGTSVHVRVPFKAVRDYRDAPLDVQTPRCDQRGEWK